MNEDIPLLRLQDAWRECERHIYHLFHAILQYLTEQYQDRPMLDKLNRLEKLGFIQSVESWQTIRNIRNKFAHDYPDDPEKNAAQLNLALESINNLYAMLNTVCTKLKTDYPTLDLGKSLPKEPSGFCTDCD